MTGGERSSVGAAKKFDSGSYEPEDAKMRSDVGTGKLRFRRQRARIGGGVGRRRFNEIEN